MPTLRELDLREQMRFQVEQATTHVFAALEPYPQVVRSIVIDFLAREIQIRAAAAALDQEKEPALV